MSADPVQPPGSARLEPSDRKLIVAAGHGDGAAFAEFYRRHRDVVLAFFLTRTGDAALAADLAAESFAVALTTCDRYRPDTLPPSWLFAIARRLLADSRRRGVVDDRARPRLGLVTLELHDGDVERIAGLRTLLPDGFPPPGGVERLTEPRREALRARILDELEHPRAMPNLRGSPAVARSGRVHEVPPIAEAAR
jgi:RNA polymerase sigma-70 factor (ECF subfamily)